MKNKHFKTNFNWKYEGPSFTKDLSTKQKIILLIFWLVAGVVGY